MHIATYLHPGAFDRDDWEELVTAWGELMARLRSCDDAGDNTSLIDNMLLEGVKCGVGLSSWRHAYSGEKLGCSSRTTRPMEPVRYTAGHGKYLPCSSTHCKHNDNENVCIIVARTHVHVDRIHQLYGCWFYLCQVVDVRRGDHNMWFVSVAFKEPRYQQ